MVKVRRARARVRPTLRSRGTGRGRGDGLRCALRVRDSAIWSLRATFSKPIGPVTREAAFTCPLTIPIISVDVAITISVDPGRSAQHAQP